MSPIVSVQTMSIRSTNAPHANGHANKPPTPSQPHPTISSLKPFAELARLHKPAGALLIYFPCLYGRLLLASTLDLVPSYFDVALLNGKLLLGSSLVRFLGCTWNDIVDQEVDKHVKRTSSRPLPRGAIDTRRALNFAALQLCAGIVLTVLILPFECLVWGIPSIFLTVLYPYGKSFTNYPQVILGLVFSWGVLLAIPAFEMTSCVRKHPLIRAAQLSLYLSCTAWTVLYGTIYAAQDVSDDARLGIRSTMIAHRRSARSFLRAMAILQFMGLTTAGIFARASPIYWIGLATIVVAIGYMVETVDLSNPADCGWWFAVGNVRIAMLMSLVFLVQFMSSMYGKSGMQRM